MMREKDGWQCGEMVLTVFDLMTCTLLETLSAFADEEGG